MPAARSRADDRRVVGRRPALQDLRPASGRHVRGGEHILERQRDTGQRRRQLIAGRHRGIDAGGRGQRLLLRDVQERVVLAVGLGDPVQAGPGDLDRRQLLGGDLGAQRRAASQPRISCVCHSALPQNPRDGESALGRLGRLRQRLLLRQPRLDDVRAGDVDVLQRVVGGLDVGDVDGLDLADVLEDGVELAGEAVQLVVGQGKPGQAREVGNLVSGDLRHDIDKPSQAPTGAGAVGILPQAVVGRNADRGPVQQCCACLRICCGSSWRTDRAASAHWPWRSARWAPTSCPSTWWSAARATRSTTWSSICRPARCPTC